MSFNTSENSLLADALAGKQILFDDSRFSEIDRIVEQNTELLRQFNYIANTRQARRQLIKNVIGKPIQEGTDINPPFNSDFGRHIFIGKRVFINRDCMFVDLGGVYLEDDVLIGPKVSLLSVNHNQENGHRRDLLPQAVHIKKHAWIGAGTVVLPGVTVGENAIVGAGSVVTKKIPANTVVVGNPARMVRKTI